jgi:hypothetical protein
MPRAAPAAPPASKCTRRRVEECAAARSFVRKTGPAEADIYRLLAQRAVGARNTKWLLHSISGVEPDRDNRDVGLHAHQRTRSSKKMARVSPLHQERFYFDGPGKGDQILIISRIIFYRGITINTPSVSKFTRISYTHSVNAIPSAAQFRAITLVLLL